LVCGDIWCASADTVFRANTGFDASDGASGYWFVRSEYSNVEYKCGDRSLYNIYPPEEDWDGFYEDFSNFIHSCGALGVPVDLKREGLDTSTVLYAGFGMNIAGEEYLGDDKYLYATLPKADKPTMMQFGWDDFKPVGKDGIFGKEASKNLESVVFALRGEDGASDRFKVFTFGYYGTCENLK